MKYRNCDECNDGMDNPIDFDFKNKIWAAQLQARQILITGDIKDDIIEKAVVQVYNFNDIDDASRLSIPERTPIQILINTNGGVMHETFSLVSAIETSQTPVFTVALGKAMSSGFIILLAGHQRFAQRYSTLMYHQGVTGGVGEINKLIEYAEFWKDLQIQMEEYVLRKTKIKRKKIDEIFSHKQDWFIKPEEAIKLGIIDGYWREF